MNECPCVANGGVCVCEANVVSILFFFVKITICEEMFWGGDVTGRLLNVLDNSLI